jgi:alpha-tubulin suppressor-like RCC1 family protein
VYSVGHGDNGQLGQGQGNKFVPTPLPLELPNEVKIMQIDAGVSHNVLVSYCGKLLTHGFGGFGQLGHGGTRSLFSPEVVVDLLHVKIVFAAAGPKQTLCVDSNGQCYAFGWGEDGTLALGNYENVNRPRIIEALEGVNIKMVAASQEMSLFVSFQGTAYWSGVGMGQLREYKTCLPTVIRMAEHVKWGSLGDSHAVLLTKSYMRLSLCI